MRRQITLLLLCAACSRSTPPPPPQATVPQAPPAQGCERDLSGMWRHSADPTFQWHIADDKTRVELHPMRGAPDANDPHAHHHGDRDDAARITLTRAGKTLAGHAESRARTLDGSTECAVSFRAWADSCGESEMVISMEQSYDVGPDCQRAAAGHEAGSSGSTSQPAHELDMATHRLVRAP